MIYKPSEDTYLISEQVKLYAKDKKVLDMGTGSGYIAEVAHASGAKSVTAVDINKEAIENIKKHNKHEIKFIHSDLFDKIYDIFDVIVFNPPYLPLDKKEDKESRLSTTGGKRGDELILRFLSGSKKHINKSGIILLLLSSLTPRERINKKIYSLGLISEQLSTKSIFFESIEVLKIKNQ